MLQGHQTFQRKKVAIRLQSHTSDGFKAIGLAERANHPKPDNNYISPNATKRSMPMTSAVRFLIILDLQNNRAIV